MDAAVHAHLSTRLHRFLRLALSPQLRTLLVVLFQRYLLLGYLCGKQFHLSLVAQLHGISLRLLRQCVIPFGCGLVLAEYVAVLRVEVAHCRGGVFLCHYQGFQLLRLVVKLHLNLRRLPASLILYVLELVQFLGSLARGRCQLLDQESHACYRRTYAYGCQRNQCHSHRHGLRHESLGAESPCYLHTVGEPYLCCPQCCGCCPCPLRHR